MAIDTPKSLRQMVIYQVYNRNHNASGTFNELIEDLDRIKNLGVDILYLLPIHPIGQKDKKGELGCPYSIQNYREVNPEYGTLDDFKRLIEATHEHGMKLKIDVVFNHTSRDSHLLNTHPEWFYKNEDGNFANRVGDWSDITDLDYSKGEELWAELLDTLEYWASLGVDGYRCDVASLVPIEFWVRARKEIAKINPNFIWLAESVHIGFVNYIRSLGYEAASDSEVYQAFDICYDYDVFEEYQGYLRGKNSLNAYIDRVAMQEGIYPDNYVKLRCLENHDQDRAATLIPNIDQLFTWTAFTYLQKGTTMIYAGQEALDTNRPSLFDIDKVNWSRYNEHGLADYMKQLSELKHDAIMAEGFYRIQTGDVADTVILSYETSYKTRVAIFNFSSKSGVVSIEIADGIYKDCLTNKEVVVQDGKVQLDVRAIVFDIAK